VKGIVRQLGVGPGRQNTAWLTLLLLLVVLVPTICLIWFMNQAVHNERFAVRQKLVDAYRGHLTLAVERLNGFWRQTAKELDAEAAESPAAVLFAKLIQAGSADAIICLNPEGKVLYPASAQPPKLPGPEDGLWTEARGLEGKDAAAAAEAFGRLAQQTTNLDLAARALQGQARCLIQAGQKEAALGVITTNLGQSRYAHAVDEQGRLVAPNAELMAIELLKDSAPDQARHIVEGLRRRLLEYDNPAMSGSQRRFLMHEVQSLFPAQAAFPTLAAEELAARFIEAGHLHGTEPGLRPTALPGIWQFASRSGRVVTLHESERLVARMRAGAAAQVLPSDVELSVLPPGKEFERYLLSTPVGAESPGWRLALSLKDQRLFDAAADQRIAAYVWIGALVVVAVVVLASLALRLVQRQFESTQLRKDLVANVTHELKTPLASMRLLVDTLLNSKTLNEPTAREYLELIAKENLRLSRLIDNFLAFSRMERNKYALDFKEVPARTLVENAAAAVHERFSVPGCRFQVEMPPVLPRIVADADAMVTALVNLLDNAYKYSGDQKEISLQAKAENGSVCFTVKDNGIGLSPRQTKKIFKRFYQVDQRLSRTTGGCGLGLSIVKFVVTAHHGTVRVESQPERGSAFTITLPSVLAQ
jgi:signal transduction histidine kinase